MISFRIVWFALLAVHRTLKSLLRYHSSKALILHEEGPSAFFMVQLSHLYMTTGKTIALTVGTFLCIVMSLLFNMLSRFVITFLPRIYGVVLISAVQQSDTVIHIYTLCFIFCSIMVYPSVLNAVLCA